VLTSSTKWDRSKGFNVQWGARNDCPSTTDFDGDHKADMVVFRPRGGTWSVLTSGTNWDRNKGVNVQWGRAGDYAMGQYACDGTDHESLSVLYINAAGTGLQQGVDSSTRAQRIADWASRNGKTPDVIALGEFYGWLDVSFLPGAKCQGLRSDVGDYHDLDILMYKLRAATGVTYRVAYLTGRLAKLGYPDRCDMYWAQSMLYNPARLVNLTAQDTSEHSYAHDAETDFDGSPLKGVHLRRSLPLCHRDTNFMPLESLIDGRPQTDKCGRQTPSGPAWAVLPPPRLKAIQNTTTSSPASSGSHSCKTPIEQSTYSMLIRGRARRMLMRP
jgi:hypothetical protein